MTIKKGQVIETDITDIAFGGSGIARINGFVVFIENAIPGDRVRAVITKKKKNHGMGRIVEMLRPSVDRIIAPCRYSEYCGGCKWQFVKYPKQLDYKRRHVQDAVTHIGLVKDIPIHPTLPSEKIYGYRNKMEFSCSDRRWVLPKEMDNPLCHRDFAIGLHVPGVFNKVIDIESCLIQPEMGNGILSVIRQAIRDSDLPIYNLKTHEGFWRFIMLRHSATHNRWMVNIVTSRENTSSLQPLVNQLSSSFPTIVSIINNITARKAGIAVGEYEIVLYGEPVLTENIGNHTYEISANSFFQTNTRSAEKLYRIVSEYADLSGHEYVLDLYSGTGTIAISLSDSAGQIDGIEISWDAVQDALKNVRINNIDNCRFLHGDIKENLSQIKKQPDVIIIDPPRVGMHKQVVQQVLDIAPKKIVYVSCNPTTLARDLAMLKDRYQIKEIQPVDMFPHTYHIESVARLEK